MDDRSAGHAPSTIERAYQLARSGSYRSVQQIRQRLIAERHDQVLAHLSGAQICGALRAICLEHARPAQVTVDEPA